MGHKMRQALRRFGVRTLIAIIPTAIVATMATNLLVPTEKRAISDIAFIETASIVNDSETIGFADSDLYGLSNPDGTLDEAAVLKTLDQMQALGVNDVRVAIPWAYIKPFPPGTPPPFDAYDWSREDFIVNAAQERGMGVLGVLGGTPTLYGQNPDTPGFGPSAAPDAAAFADFVSVAAARYAGQISAYEVWNEPNAIIGWNPVPNATDYTEVLKAAYTAIKAADPNAMVVGGVLGTVSTFPGITINAADFVAQMYADGAHGYFDALSIHPYQYTTEFSEGGYDPDGPISQLLDIRQLMIDHGDSALRIWATEYGLPTSGPSGVGEANQAAFIKDFLETWAGYNYTGPAFIYTTRDQTGLESTDNGSFGVYNSDWTPKLAAQVIKDLIASRIPPPTDPTPPDQVATAIGAALAAFYAQIYAALAQAYAVAYVAAIAQAITVALTQFFNAFAVPSVQQAAVVEGVDAASTTAASLANEPQAARTMVVADVNDPSGTPASALDSSSAAAGSELVHPAAGTTEAVTPAEPTTPTTPATPTEPTTPVTPVTPVTPTEPTGPVTPVTPTEPTTPATPTEPTTPVTPATPSQPVTPASPAAPTQPAAEQTPAASTPPSDRPKLPKEKASADAPSTDSHSRLPRKWRVRDNGESDGGESGLGTHTGVSGATDSHGSPSTATSPSTSSDAASASTPAAAGATA